MNKTMKQKSPQKRLVKFGTLVRSLAEAKAYWHAWDAACDRVDKVLRNRTAVAWRAEHFNDLQLKCEWAAVELATVTKLFEDESVQTATAMIDKDCFPYCLEVIEMPLHIPYVGCAFFGKNVEPCCEPGELGDFKVPAYSIGELTAFAEAETLDEDVTRTIAACKAFRRDFRVRLREAEMQIPTALVLDKLLRHMAARARQLGDLQLAEEFVLAAVRIQSYLAEARGGVQAEHVAGNAHFSEDLSRNFFRLLALIEMKTIPVATGKDIWNAMLTPSEVDLARYIKRIAEISKLYNNVF